MESVKVRGARLAMVAVLAAGQSACSSKPRYFDPQLASSPPETLILQRDVRVCDQLVRKGYKGDFRNAALQAGGGTTAAIGAGLVAASITSGTAAAGSGLGGAINAAVAPGAAGAAAFTVVLPIAIFGVTRAIRSGREKKHKRGMALCLTELGYAPTGWTKGKRPKGAIPAVPIPPGPPAESLPAAEL